MTFIQFLSYKIIVIKAIRFIFNLFVVTFNILSTGFVLFYMVPIKTSVHKHMSKFNDSHHDLVNRYCSGCRNHNTILSSLMICHHIFNKGNMTGTINVAETACPNVATYQKKVSKWESLNISFVIKVCSQPALTVHC
jgi:hypothetical protein